MRSDVAKELRFAALAQSATVPGEHLRLVFLEIDALTAEREGLRKRLADAERELAGAEQRGAARERAACAKDLRDLAAMCSPGFDVLVSCAKRFERGDHATDTVAAEP